MDIFPRLIFNTDLELALTGFEAWNSIPNVTQENNVFYYGKDQIIEFPIGSYEIEDIQNYLRLQMKEDHIKNPVSEELRGELGSEAIVLRGNTQFQGLQVLN